MRAPRILALALCAGLLLPACAQPPRARAREGGGGAADLFPGPGVYSSMMQDVSAQSRVSARLKHCGGNWEKSYLDWMQGQRRTGKWNQEQLAFIGAFHGAFMVRHANAPEVTARPCESEDSEPFDPRERSSPPVAAPLEVV